MDEPVFRLPLYLPAQGAAETEATIIEWHVAEGDRFVKGQVLAQIDSAKSVFDFEAPCDGLILRLFHLEGEMVSLTEPVLEIQTSDPTMRDWIPPAASGEALPIFPEIVPQAAPTSEPAEGVILRSVGGYLPARVVENAELVRHFPEISEQYVYQVTGIRQRRWAGEDERPSGMAFKASLEAIRKSGIATKDIDAILVATTTPDFAMPSTACILQDRLCLPTVPAFDINAACSGWLYAVSMARGMILSGMARNVLTVGVEMQLRLLDVSDRNAYFLFGDGAGAAVISAGTVRPSYPADAAGLRHAGPADGPPRIAGLCGGQRPRQRRSVDSHRRPCPVSLRHRQLHRHHSPGRGQDRLDARRNALGGAASGQRPHSQGRGQALRHRLPAICHECRDDRQHVQRQHSLSLGRGRGAFAAGRQVDSLLGRRRHDHGGDFRGVVTSTERGRKRLAQMLRHVKHHGLIWRKM